MSDQKHLDQLASLLLSTILFFLHWKELPSTFYSTCVTTSDLIIPNSKSQLEVFLLDKLWTRRSTLFISGPDHVALKFPRRPSWNLLRINILGTETGDVSRCVAWRPQGGSVTPAVGPTRPSMLKRLSVLASKDSVKSAVHAAGPRQFWWLRIHCPFPSKVRI